MSHGAAALEPIELSNCSTQLICTVCKHRRLAAGDEGGQSAGGGAAGGLAAASGSLAGWQPQTGCPALRLGSCCLRAPQGCHPRADLAPLDWAQPTAACAQRQRRQRAGLGGPLLHAVPLCSPAQLPAHCTLSVRDQPGVQQPAALLWGGSCQREGQLQGHTGQDDQHHQRAFKAQGGERSGVARPPAPCRLPGRRSPATCSSPDALERRQPASLQPPRFWPRA